MKSEFIALDKAGEEAKWLQNFLEDISYWPKPVAPVCIHCDSQAAIGRAGSMMYNGKSRHIRRRHNTVRELLSNGIITVDYVKSKDNISDPLTKGLSREGVEKTSKGMGLSLGRVSMAVTLPSRLEIPRARDHLCEGKVEAASKRMLVKAYSLSSHENRDVFMTEKNKTMQPFSKGHTDSWKDPTVSFHCPPRNEEVKITCRVGKTDACSRTEISSSGELELALTNKERMVTVARKGCNLR
ncbi:hypothetical protein T459_07197 [Capsicum annuum]|uniref:Retrovirus-related Pol polyprotein from transposon TNT 1-94 n=1 Tax=Capsicum annuum TaxID=4072 RepID=A0A2G3ACX5_CAPAN|nr:hypothetical protein T459_07197 [Capsicum annuum]